MTTQDLEKKAYEIRMDIIQALLAAKSGHTGGPLGMADIFTALYFAIAHVDPKNPIDPERDRIVLSNAHICPVLYATLAQRGFCSREQFLTTLRKLGSPFQGHSNNHFNLGIETCGGPLAQGISQAVGMALAGRMNKASWQVYCLTGDGELNEGQCWEAIMMAGKERLSNLTAIVDRNHIQIDGDTEDIMPLEPLADKWRAFGWNVIDMDGHNMEDILERFKKAQAYIKGPTVLLAHTIPGKGVSFMENKYEWHGKPPNAEEAKLALAELQTIYNQL
ncbi:transketolase [Patescibacteria group bacterium]|nr:transketolase [Patescibacteria group bacterium]MBP9710036.1 transketolase [Patescibacteria group bacterium]